MYIDLLIKEEEKPAPIDDIDDDEVGIDDLLEEDVPEENFDEKSDIKNLSYSLKISNDDDGGLDDDV